MNPFDTFGLVASFVALTWLCCLFLIWKYGPHWYHGIPVSNRSWRNHGWMKEIPGLSPTGMPTKITWSPPRYT
jgi:hypothetical protein